jgi:hypothetical protein
VALSNIFTHGQANATGDSLALFLKVSSGEVLTAFRRDCVTKSIPFRRRTVSGGKTTQFKVTARTTATGHQRGDWLLEDTSNAAGVSPSPSPYLRNPKVAEVVVGLDRALVSGAFFDELDDLMAPESAELRQEWAYMAGEAIARKYDSRRLINIAQGAEATPYNTDLTGGTSLTGITNMFSVASDTLDAIADMAAAMDEKYVPSEGRIMFVTPTDYYWMVQNLKTDIINTDYRGVGSVAQGVVESVMGFRIVKTTNLPTTNITTDAAGGDDSVVSAVNDYLHDCSNIKALFCHPEAIGIVEPAGMGGEPTVVYEKHQDRLGEVIFAKAYSGSKFLRPEACGSIKSA